MSVPVHDWQFWVVTAAALWGVFTLVRTVWPKRKKSGEGAPPCPRCASGTAACAGKKTEAPAEKLVTLGGRRA